MLSNSVQIQQDAFPTQLSLKYNQNSKINFKRLSWKIKRLNLFFLNYLINIIKTFNKYS